MQKNSYDTTTLIVQATGVMQGLISLLLLLLFSIAHARVAFLDIIHSASRSVSAVFDSFKLEIAIASPSFASLFEKCPLQHNDSPCQGAARSLSSKSRSASSYCCSSLSDVMFWEPCLAMYLDHLLWSPPPLIQLIWPPFKGGVHTEPCLAMYLHHLLVNTSAPDPFLKGGVPTEPPRHGRHLWPEQNRAWQLVC